MKRTEEQKMPFARKYIPIWLMKKPLNSTIGVLSSVQDEIIHSIKTTIAIIGLIYLR